MIYNSEEKPRFKQALSIANTILTSSGLIGDKPFSVKKFIAEKSNIKFKTYSKAGSYGIDINDFGTDDAILMLKDNRYIIFYNEQINSKGRIRFSLLHEYGHYLFGHDLDNKLLYKIYEVEADFFAAQILMPEQVIIELRNRGKEITAPNLMAWFNVSRRAAKKRMETLNKINYEYRSYNERCDDQAILLQYKSFIDAIAPKRNYSFDYLYDEEEMQRERDTWLYNRR